MVRECDVIKKIQELGVNNACEAVIKNALRESVEYIKAYCNIERLPKELFNIAVDIAAGRVLEYMLSKGQLQWGNTAFENENVKSIAEGDVSVTFGEGNTQSARAEKCIGDLCNKDHILVRYRRLRW